MPSNMPLIPVSSEYDRLLVQEPLHETGGGPMDPAADERLLVLDDASRNAAEGVAERIAARAASPRGFMLGSIACLALMCVAAFRKVESHDASLAARFSEGMFQRRGEERAKPRVVRHAVAREGHEFPLEHRLAPRLAAMPRHDDGAARPAVDEIAAGTSERGASRAAKRGAAKARSTRSARVARRQRADLGRGSDFSVDWGPWEDEAEANGHGETYGGVGGVGGGGGGGGHEDWLAYDADASPAAEEEDAFFAVDADSDARGAARRETRRRSGRTSARPQRVGVSDDAFLPVVEPTEVAHGATHQAALDELEASIKSSVVEAHERRQKQKRADAETKRGARG